MASSSATNVGVFPEGWSRTIVQNDTLAALDATPFAPDELDALNALTRTERPLAP